MLQHLYFTLVVHKAQPVLLSSLMEHLVCQRVGGPLVTLALNIDTEEMLLSEFSALVPLMPQLQSFDLNAASTSNVLPLLLSAASRRLHSLKVNCYKYNIKHLTYLEKEKNGTTKRALKCNSAILSSVTSLTLTGTTEMRALFLSHFKAVTSLKLYHSSVPRFFNTDVKVSFFL